MPRFSKPIPLALYVHIPWCVRKCPYCDFNSHATRGDLPERAYVEALLTDVEQDLLHVGGRLIESIFIGGGTPSLFSAEAIERLLTSLRARLDVKPDAEITLEANPGTLEQSKFAEFRAAGINRLSIGIQSFNPDHLARLGRIHDRQEAIRAIEAAHAGGFDNFNVDLMFGLPDQSIEQALADLANAIALEPSHISHYQLTLEPNTLFYKYPPGLPDDEVTWAMQERCQRRLVESGYSHYEVSAYARAGKRCRHNINYWEFGDYLGIGAGAHGKLTDPMSGIISRRWKLKHPRAYLAYAGTPKVLGGSEVVMDAQLPFEFMLNALRLVEGVPAALFNERTGLALERITPALERAREQGLLEVSSERLCATDLGQRFLNDLVSLFLPESNHSSASFSKIAH